MKILILGGTRFVGRHLVDRALARGHQLTLFNRGQSNPELFPEVEQVHGDRDRGLDALSGRRWDAVIDTCGYIPRHVREAAGLLVDAVEHYTFISTVAVYADFSQPGLTEAEPLSQLTEGSKDEFKPENYGPLKVLCEQAAEAMMPGRVLVIRPGLIVGPHDTTDRFTYWPWRIARAGEVLAPAGPDYRLQFIDARDLADWTIQMVEARQTGVYNAAGPARPTSFGELLSVCPAASGVRVRITWVAEEFLLDQQVEPWVDLPLWLPGEAYAGLHHVNVDKAVAHGLRFRTLFDTVRDTLAWAATLPEEHAWAAGLDPEREARLLEIWHRQTDPRGARE